METKYQVIIHSASVKEDWPSLPKVIQDRVGTAIMAKLTAHPEVYGKPLRRSLKNNRKLRVGDYRIIFRIQKKTVIIWLIAHRSIVYAKAIKRLAGENRP